ncbi:hypothetical protein [Phycisphaera mikurensis]|uniref:Uncharacterized protein n=1 Tax=Phycisphaera mikurensis (strain NBRC 102666 / KCTC 22515 / FYK2301M01) TaxID=1142394 RepID=I0IFU4_PHYMF|nr:hypothetical protein [Phycisphaera mikurensis]MBB6440479.1 hypothetical protein [Phycisphaera mikurensis]BAM04132.1 hypothetical protein PSMK_19730 [Phycisphaera mikurensis NBRC 102666]
MSLQAGAGGLEEARKVLLARWRQVREGWDDEVARRFGDDVIEPLLQDLGRAAEAMTAAATEEAQARRDCG